MYNSCYLYEQPPIYSGYYDNSSSSTSNGTNEQWAYNSSYYTQHDRANHVGVISTRTNYTQWNQTYTPPPPTYQHHRPWNNGAVCCMQQKTAKDTDKMCIEEARPTHVSPPQQQHSISCINSRGMQHQSSIECTTPTQASINGYASLAQNDSSSQNTTVHSKESIDQGNAEEVLELDKKAIYKHPLFPLMALVFERCEQASSSADITSADTFDIDIQTFVHNQEQERRPFFSEDSELDSLMVKAIQVLRIHLLEIEKVNELCKDFCQRYRTCLRGKLHSENLIKGELNMDDEDSMVVDLQNMNDRLSGGGVGAGYTNENNNSNGGIATAVVAAASPVPGIAAASGNSSDIPSQVISGGTVYQMVQTPHGLVAQPIQLHAPQSPQHQPTQAIHTSTSPGVGGGGSGSGTPVQQPSGSPVIHGGMTLGQIGASSPSQSSQQNGTGNLLAASLNTLAQYDDECNKNKTQKRGVLPKAATQVMKTWLFQHIVHPYPTEDEKRQIASQTNLSMLQVNNWFINARRRILQPMLDSGNHDNSTTKNKARTTKPNPQKAQRFWPGNIANLTATPPTLGASEGSTNSTMSPDAEGQCDSVHSDVNEHETPTCDDRQQQGDDHTDRDSEVHGKYEKNMT